METRLLYPITTATNVLVKTGFFKNKTLALVIELLRQNSGGGGNTEPEEIPEGITDFSQAPSDNVVYEGDDYPKGAYTRVTLDQGILYSDLKFVLYSHPFDVYTISLNVVIGRLNALNEDNISFGDVLSITSPTVWVPRFDSFMSSLPTSTEPIVKNDSTYTFRKIQDSPLGSFGYWTDSPYYWELPAIPYYALKQSKLIVLMPKNLFVSKKDLGDTIILTQEYMQEHPEMMQTVEEELMHLMEEIQSLYGDEEPSQEELMNMMYSFVKIIIDGTRGCFGLDLGKGWVFNMSNINGNQEYLPVVNDPQSAQRYQNCIIYSDSDYKGKVGESICVRTLSNENIFDSMYIDKLGDGEGSITDSYPFSANTNRENRIVVLRDTYVVITPQSESGYFWEDSSYHGPLEGNLSASDHPLSMGLGNTICLNAGDHWVAVGEVDLSSVYSQLESMGSDISDMSSNISTLQNTVSNFKALQYKQINIYNDQDPTYTIENLEYPTLYHVNYAVRPDNYDYWNYDYDICYGGEVTIKVKTVNEYTTFQAPVNGQFLVVPYYFDAQEGGGSTNAIIGINFPIEKTEISKVLTGNASASSYFVQKGGVLNVLNTSALPITVYLKNEYVYYHDYDESGNNDPSKSKPITIKPGESLKLVKTLYTSTNTYAEGYDEWDNKHFLKFVVEYKKCDPETLNIPTKEFTVNGVTFKMIKVDGGTFKMGSPEEEHPVSVDGFYIGEIEVTNLLKNAVLNTSEGNANYAVENLTWSGANSFIESLNNLVGVCFRLPTEAEWEFAARGGNFTLGNKYSGMKDLSYNDIFGWSQSFGLPPVKKCVNELGLWDMSGGVEEWCYDNFKVYDRETIIDPVGPDSPNDRYLKVIRGGNYGSSTSNCENTYREYLNSSTRYKWTGLRLASDYSGESPYLTVTVGNVSFNMIDVEGDEFLMGKLYDEHPVFLSSFSIGETEVTLELWEEVMGSNPSYRNESPLNPVECVSWEDCMEFILELNNRTGLNFRLPTEAEWEFAAKGGNLSLGYTYSGSNTLTDVARCDSNTPRTLHPAVKQKQPNELGLYDMSGLVWELCSGDSNGYAIFKGGDVYSNAESCTIFNRKVNRSYDLGGLRLVSDDPTSLNLSSSGINMIFVEGGTYTKNGETITVNDFYIADAPITNQQFYHFYYNDDSNISNEPTYIVEDESDALSFLNDLNSALGVTFRLPTEEEWEFAALGGNLSHNYTYSGSNDINDVAWYEKNITFTTTSVKSYSPNELGIYDMSGNVSEWCLDWYGTYEKGEIVQTLLTNPCVIDSNIQTHVTKGGSHHEASVSTRFVYARKASSGIAGLRLVLPIEPNITHSFSRQADDWLAPLASDRPEQVEVKVNGNYLGGNYTSEIVSGTNWEKLSEYTFQIPSSITGARTAASPYLTINDLILKITKGINTFRYTIPGREVPTHFPLFMGTILDASDVTSDFTITNFWANYHYSNSPEEIHKICNISVVNSSLPFYDGTNTFNVYAPNKSLSLSVILLYMGGSFKYAAGYICICTKGTASIKYFGQELLECVLNNATIKMSSTTWATGMKIYLSKNRICEDLTGLDVNITIE